jgi:hypothetical protein
MTIPADCLEMQLTCDEIEELFSMGDPEAPDEMPADVNCTQSTETDPCVCTIELQAEMETEVGSYSTSDTSLTFTPDEGQDDADPSTLEFCVDGDSLTVFDAAADDEPASVISLSR